MCKLTKTFRKKNERERMIRSNQKIAANENESKNPTSQHLIRTSSNLAGNIQEFLSKNLSNRADATMLDKTIEMSNSQINSMISDTDEETPQTTDNKSN